MTIFVSVLQKSIQNALSAITTDLDSKSNGPLNAFYDKTLSLGQKNRVADLLRKILGFKASGRDEADKNAIIDIINSASAEIKVMRNQHNKSREDGGTVPALAKLVVHVDEFYKKIRQFNAQNNVSNRLILLNKPYNHSPIDEVYKMAVIYFAEGIFSPKSGNSKVTEQKEELLRSKLQTLYERIASSSFSFQEQKLRALETLEDLTLHNKEIAHTLGKSFKVPLQVWGISAKGPSYGARTARLGLLLEVTEKEISKMTQEDEEYLSESPRLSSASMFAAASNRRPSMVSEEEAFVETPPARAKTEKMNTPANLTVHSGDEPEAQEEEAVEESHNRSRGKHKHNKQRFHRAQEPVEAETGADGLDSAFEM